MLEGRAVGADAGDVQPSLVGEGVTADAQGNVYAGEVGPIQGLTKFIPRLKR